MRDGTIVPKRGNEKKFFEKAQKKTREKKKPGKEILDIAPCMQLKETKNSFIMMIVHISKQIDAHTAHTLFFCFSTFLVHSVGLDIKIS